jgi:AAA+ ATPase superfamily predicted ATPase
MIKIDDLFKPGSPINKKEMLVGRTRQINHINKVLYSGGRAVVITGARGIGKTSLANVTASLNGNQVKADCDTDSTFHSWVLDLLSELGADAKIIEKTVEETLGASKC